MNPLNRAQSSAYGRYLSSTVLKDAPCLNLRQSDTPKPANTLISHSRHAIPTIWSNNDPTNRDIALFDPRNETSIMMYEQNGDMSLFQKIRNSNKSKIVTLGDDLEPNTAPQFSLSPNTLDDVAKNSCSPYFPYLANSKSNKRPADLKPTLIDSRMLHHTTDRDFAWGDDQVQAARNLLYSPRRWQRQEAVDDQTRRLLHMGEPVDRWNENKNAYVSRPSVPPEYLIDDLKKRIESSRTYNSLDDEATLQHINRTALNPIYSYREAGMGVKDLNHLQSGNNDIVQTRYMNDYDYSYRAPLKPLEDANNKKEKESFLSQVSGSITSTVMKLFKKNTTNNTETYTRSANINAETESFIPEPRYDGSMGGSIHSNYSIQNRMNRLKTNNSYLIRDGEIEVVAPDMPHLYGSSYISPMSRMMCLESDGQLHVIQKLDPDRILGSDARPVGDDLVVTVLPKKYTDKIRSKLHDSEGRKFKELETKDYLALLEIVSRDPSLMQRVKAETIRNQLLDDKIDKMMLDEFSGMNTLVNDDALAAYVRDIETGYKNGYKSEINRKKYSEEKDKYIQKETYESWNDENMLLSSDMRLTRDDRSMMNNNINNNIMNERIPGRIDNSAIEDERARIHHDSRARGIILDEFDGNNKNIDGIVVGRNSKNISEIGTGRRERSDGRVVGSFARFRNEN